MPWPVAYKTDGNLPVIRHHWKKLPGLFLMTLVFLLQSHYPFSKAQTAGLGLEEGGGHLRAGVTGNCSGDVAVAVCPSPSTLPEFPPSPWKSYPSPAPSFSALGMAAGCPSGGCGIPAGGCGIPAVLPCRGQGGILHLFPGNDWGESILLHFCRHQLEADTNHGH